MKTIDNVEASITKYQKAQILDRTIRDHTDSKVYFITPENSEVRLLFTLSPFHVMIQQKH